jgi:hypothetical protein
MAIPTDLSHEIPTCCPVLGQAGRVSYWDVPLCDSLAAGVATSPLLILHDRWGHAVRTPRTRCYLHDGRAVRRSDRSPRCPAIANASAFRL